ncbi:hypothetical protein V7S79_12200, partial [Aquirufa sp. ROCK-SH2]
FTNVAAGTYTLRVKNADGCVKASTSTLTVVANAGLPTIPVSQLDSLTNNCNVNSVDLTQAEPSSVSGISYEWWRGTDSTRASRILNPTTYSSTSKVYLWSKTADGCYSFKADSLQVQIVTCCVDSVGVLAPTEPNVGFQYEPATINYLAHTGYTAGSVVRYVLVNQADGKIKAINNISPEFSGIGSGYYKIHALVVRPETTITGLSEGNKFNNVLPNCTNTPFYQFVVFTSCDYESIWSMPNPTTLPAGKSQKFVLVDGFDSNKIVAVSDSSRFNSLSTYSSYEIVQIQYTGTISNLAVGNLLSSVTATDLDLFSSRYFSHCEPVVLQIDGEVFNDLNNNGTIDYSTESATGLPPENNDLFVKVLDSNNTVLAVSPVVDHYFTLSSSFEDGTYRLIFDTNEDMTDTTLTTPAYWESNPKEFVVEGGSVITPNFFSGGATTTQLGMHCTLPAPLPGVSGDSVSYCLGARANQLEAQAVSNATLNWYTVETGGTSSMTAPTPSTDSSGTFHYYVSQTLQNMESARTTFTVIV